MQPNEIIEAVRELVTTNKPFALATVDDSGAPWMRWMGGMVLDEPLTMTMAAVSDSRKVEHIRANPRTQVMFQTENYHSVATLFGVCELVSDPEVRQHIWDTFPGLSHYAAGPDDEGLAVIRFVPDRVELILLDEHGTTPLACDVPA